MMNILSVGSDAQLLVNGSEVQKRMIGYGKLFDTLTIIVRTTGGTRQSIILSPQVTVYSTASRSKFGTIGDAYRIGKGLLTHGNYTALTAQDPFESGWVAWRLKRFGRVPLQLQVHTDVLSSYFKKESMKNRIRVVLARWLLPRADRVRVVSERIRTSLIQRWKIDPRRIVVIPIFVDVDKIIRAPLKADLRQRYPEWQQRIVMISRLTQEKNIAMAIAALSKIKTALPKTLLVIVGEGLELEHLKKSARDLGVADAVVFEPWTKDTSSYYKTADVFLLTSYYEGYGRTVVEAMAAGAPVVMTDVGVAGEVLIDDLDGLVVPVNDSNALAAALIRLFADEQTRSGFIREAQRAINSLPKRDESLQAYRKALEFSAV